ncbi:hypothetical protein [Granulosicoccus antarcticus]|uniref:Fe2OG dioxygenase domain-containing protein n=1 Tax=Granulosicoccus antarcticus IMCC3135 TaxID=1192854 RepID=A0A2Z2P2P8_9GAMM|nr:hypothetical protein [Granulosicoccus antarcticus]ASJ73984.1 hypothetical protein IMCC3135_19525 [Granulosicoccus antarcticus IMCC3135]
MMTTRQRPAIIASGGALLIDQLISATLFRALFKECASQRSVAKEQVQTTSGQGHWRSADPARHLASADGGPSQMAFYHDTDLHHTLSQWCGCRLKPTSGCGTYSYYDQQGHFLARHRDIRTCDVTLVTCLHRVDAPVPSGALRVYPASIRTPLERIDAAAAHRDLHPQQSQSVLLLGGCVPHEVLPAADGFQRWISVLCFQMVKV